MTELFTDAGGGSCDDGPLPWTSIPLVVIPWLPQEVPVEELDECDNDVHELDDSNQGRNSEKELHNTFCHDRVHL